MMYSDSCLNTRFLYKLKPVGFMDNNQFNVEVIPFLDPFEPPERLPYRYLPPWMFIGSYDLHGIIKIDN